MYNILEKVAEPFYKVILKKAAEKAAITLVDEGIKAYFYAVKKDLDIKIARESNEGKEKAEERPKEN